MTVYNGTPPAAVVGTGVAGLNAALSLASERPVVVFTKTSLQFTNTSLAQGGIATAWSAQDTPKNHIDDTLKVGGGINNTQAVELLCTEGPAAVKKLIEFGANFDRGQDGQYRLALEGAHSTPRVLHAGGDATGAEIQRALSEAALAHPNIQVLEHTRLTGLITDETGMTGIDYIGPDGESHRLETDTVVLASGGAGQVYQYTANQTSATAESLIFASQVGAKLADIEFFQFHPTGLALPGQANLLISEAVRGEGALLVNQAGEPFMEKYHSQGALAARDVVSRAIQAEAEKSGQVYLDATKLKNEPVDVRFPNIFRRCLDLGVDARIQPIPVSPVAHYMMGGIKVDVAGRTDVAGLYAVGEISRTGVHGASRLASNSLLEGAVFGQQVAQTILADAVNRPSCWAGACKPPVDLPAGPDKKVLADRGALQQAMWTEAGLIRDAEGLTHLIAQLQASLGTGADPKEQGAFEFYSLKLFGLMMAQSALLRAESRGSHFRRDFPVLDPSQGRSIIHQYFQPPTFE